MKEKVFEHLNLLLKRYPVLEVAKDDIARAYGVLEEAYLRGGKLMIAGNGGSAADAEHIVGELMKSFKKARGLDPTYISALLAADGELGAELAENLQGALPAIALDGHFALTTAYMNDCTPLMCFAQQLNGFGKAGDVFLALSTSGNSKNILYAAVVARAKGLKIVSMTGSRNSRLSEMSDVCIKVPERETYMVQELHLPIYHCLCLMLEERFFA